MLGFEIITAVDRLLGSSGLLINLRDNKESNNVGGFETEDRLFRFGEMQKMTRV